MLRDALLALVLGHWSDRSRPRTCDRSVLDESVLDDVHRLTEVDMGLAVHPAAPHRLAQFWILKVRPRLFWGGELDHYQYVVRSSAPR